MNQTPWKTLCNTKWTRMTSNTLLCDVFVYCDGLSFFWTCIFMMDSRAWDESESRDQYLHLLHTLTIGVTRTRKIAASLFKTVTYVEDWLNTNRLLRTFNNRFVLPNLLTCYMNQVRHCLVYRALVISVKDTYFLLSETGIRFISVNLGEPLDWLITVIFSEMVVGTKNK